MDESTVQVPVSLIGEILHSAEFTDVLGHITDPLRALLSGVLNVDLVAAPVPARMRKHTSQCLGFSSGFTDPSQCTCGAEATGALFASDNLRALANKRQDYERTAQQMWELAAREALRAAADRLEAVQQYVNDGEVEDDHGQHVVYTYGLVKILASQTAPKEDRND